MDSEARAYRVAAQKRADGTFLGRGSAVCSYRRGEREVALARLSGRRVAAFLPKHRFGGRIAATGVIAFQDDFTLVSFQKHIFMI